MELFKSINHLKGSKYYIFVWLFFLSMTTINALASEHKLYFRKNQRTFDFEEIYFQNSIPYDEYDSLDGQFKSFFGLNSDQSLTNYYPDLNIISSSYDLRAIYRSKLNDMILGRFIYKLKK